MYVFLHDGNLRFEMEYMFLLDSHIRLSFFSGYVHLVVSISSQSRSAFSHYVLKSLVKILQVRICLFAVLSDMK